MCVLSTVHLTITPSSQKGALVLPIFLTAEENKEQPVECTEGIRVSLLQTVTAGPPVSEGDHFICFLI